MKISSAASFLLCLYYRSVTVPVFAAPIYANSTEMSVTANVISNSSVEVADTILEKLPDTCDVKPVDLPENKCLDPKKAAEEAKAEFDKSIKKLRDLYEGTLACEGKDDTYKKYEACIGVSKSICDLEDRKEEVADKIKEACVAQSSARVEIETAKMAMSVAAAQFLPTDTTRPNCATTSIDSINNLEVTKHSLIKVNLVLKNLNGALEVAKDSIDSITYFGAAAGVVLGVAIVVIKVLIFVIENLIIDINVMVQENKFRDGPCVAERKEFYNDLAIDTFVLEETIDEKVTRIETKAVSIESIVNIIDGKVNGIGNEVAENQLILQFLSCRFEKSEKTFFIGAGCDGLDNDCDSDVLGIKNGLSGVEIIKRVDECDEDRVPPTITLARDPPATFPSQEHGETWFLENTLVSDDCVPSYRLTKSIINPMIMTEGQVTILVVDTRCENMTITWGKVNGQEVIVDGPGEPSATKTFVFTVDENPPTVTCGFYKPQDINYLADGDQTDPLFIDFVNEKEDIVNVQFWYQVQKIPPISGDVQTPPISGENVDVQIVVTSNENEGRNGRQMLDIFERRSLGGPLLPVHRVTLLLAPFTCRDNKAGRSCLVEKDTTSRFYDITVVVTDSSGNVGDVTCTVAVVPEYRYPKSSKKAGGKRKKSGDRVPRKNLVSQLAASKQRFLLDEYKLVWDTASDEGVVTPVPTAAPTGKSQKSRRDGITIRK